MWLDFPNRFEFARGNLSFLDRGTGAQEDRETDGLSHPSLCVSKRPMGKRILSKRKAVKRKKKDDQGIQKDIGRGYLPTGAAF